MILVKSQLSTPRLSTRRLWRIGCKRSEQFNPNKSSEGVPMGDKDGTILIVDDDQDTREGLMTLLGEDHYCVAAGTAEEAVRLLAAKPFDLLLTDIHMPGASGLELCRLAHRLSPDTVVIVVSGMSDIRYQIEAMRQGTLYYIEKPVDLERLTTLIGSALKCQALGAARHRSNPTKPYANNSLGAKAS